MTTTTTALTTNPRHAAHVEYRWSGELVGCSSVDDVVRMWSSSHGALDQYSTGGKLQKVVWVQGHDCLGRKMVGTLDVDGNARLFVDGREAFAFGTGATDLESGPARYGAQMAVCKKDVLVFERMSHRIDDWQRTATLACEDGSCLSWDPSGDSPGIAVGTVKGDVKIWRKADVWSLIESRSIGGGPITDIAWSPQAGVGPLIALTTANGCVHLSNTDASLIALYDGSGRGVFWNNSGSLLAVTDDAHVCRVWKRNFQDNWILLRVYKAPATNLSST